MKEEICDEKCFECKFEDCIRPSQKCRTEPHVSKLFALSEIEKKQRRAAYDKRRGRRKRKRKKQGT